VSVSALIAIVLVAGATFWWLKKVSEA
jgi:hypothetical protein